MLQDQVSRLIPRTESYGSTAVIPTDSTSSIVKGPFSPLSQTAAHSHLKHKRNHRPRLRFSFSSRACFFLCFSSSVSRLPVPVPVQPQALQPFSHPFPGHPAPHQCMLNMNSSHNACSSGVFRTWIGPVEEVFLSGLPCTAVGAEAAPAV